MALTMKDVQKDREALKNNYLFVNRHKAITWANEHDNESLSFVNKCDAYAHFTGETDKYKADADAFNAVAVKYYKNDGSKVTLADLLK